MPPPHSFWVILIGKTPTSFRGKMREDLVPTLRQLQRTQSDVTLRWFERGKIWESPEAAIGAAKLAATAAREKRTREWRPGGEHRDPKARFELTRDQKRAKFKRDQSAPPDRAGRERPPRDERGGDQPQSPFGPRAPRAPRPDRPWSDRKPGSSAERPRTEFRPDRPRPDRAKADRPWPDRPKFDRPRTGGSPFPERGPRPPRAPGSDSRDRREGRDRPPSSERPFGKRPPRDDRRERPSGPPAENPFKNRSRPARPGRPPGDRGGFKPPKRRS